MPASETIPEDADYTVYCLICGIALKPGDLVLYDVSGETGHRACFGNDRDGFVKDVETGEPLGPDDPLPTGWEWKP